jgi:hypothetical protein
MTKTEISKLIAAFNKLVLGKTVTIETEILGPFEGIKLDEDEYQIIEPFLWLHMNCSYEIGSVTLKTKDTLQASCAGTSGCVLVKIPKDNLVHLRNVIELVVAQEQRGRRIKFTDYSKQEEK